MASNPSSTKVLVTGASGFIGLHTVLHLLQLGYHVRATVRREEYEREIRENLSTRVKADRLEFMGANLLQDTGWEEAAQGCDFVVHVASPFPAEEPEDPYDLIVPAHDGTLRVLQAAVAGGVRRVVLVSSTAAVIGCHEGENRTFNEFDWTDDDICPYAYPVSKTLAERAAWGFIHSTKNKTGMELTTINPSNVFGPPLGGRYFTSIEWFRTLMRREVPGVPRAQLNIVDVRDVVDLIARALNSPEAVGERFIANGASIPVKEFAEILNRNFARQGYRVPTLVLPDFLVQLVALFIPKLRVVARALGWTYRLSTEKVRSILGWQPRPYEQTIIETAQGMIEHGLI